jgi:hypothetical protein
MEGSLSGPNKKQKLTVLDAFLGGKNDDFKLVRLTYISRPVRTLDEPEKGVLCLL